MIDFEIFGDLSPEDLRFVKKAHHNKIHKKELIQWLSSVGENFVINGERRDFIVEFDAERQELIVDLSQTT